MAPAALASETTRAFRELDARRCDLMVEPNQSPRSASSKALRDFCLVSGGCGLESFERSHLLRGAGRLDPAPQQGEAGSSEPRVPQDFSERG